MYSVVCLALIFTAGYLPARILTKESAYKTEWEPPLAESFFLHLGSFESGKSSTLKVKIVATKQGATVARLLAQVLRHYDWTLEVNADDGTYVFPANTSFRGTRVRYRESQLMEVSGVFGVVSALVYIPETDHFPDDDRFNFAQIEIGDVPEYYFGPPRFLNS